MKKSKHLKRPRHLKFIITLVVLAVLMGCVYYKYTRSFSYQYAKARQADVEKDYETAVSHYLKALETDETDVKVLCEIGDDYIKLKRPAMAEQFLLRAVKADGSYERPFQLILKLYESQGAYNKMEKIYAYATTDDVKAIFKDYLIKPPVFSQEGGDYDDDVMLTLSLPEDAEDDWQIFYTTDGKAPNGVNGHLYDGNYIYLTEGKTKVRVVCRNSNGKFGEVASETFNIEYKAPNEPTVSPNGGDFTKKTKVTITADSDCTIYYSWKNQKPDQKSKKYTKAITVPKGYHVLSVVAYDRHGLKSKTYHMSFSYYPE